MNAERIVLPEPGRTLLAKTHKVLTRQFPDVGDEPGFVIGGGTILAARWKHRRSKDIDVRVSDESGLRVLSRMMVEPRLQTWMNWAMEKEGAEHRLRRNSEELV